jgi:DNA-binding NtrC family response regulator
VSETLSAIISGSQRPRSVPALYVGLAGETPREPPARIGLRDVDHVVIGRGEKRTIARAKERGAQVLTLSLSDARMSTSHARVSRVGGGWVIEDLGSKNGIWIDGERVTRRSLEDGDAVLVGHTCIVYRDRGGEDGDLDRMPAALAPGLETMSPIVAERFAAAVAAARATTPIEISGESGTGKELLARAVHRLSGRKGELVAVNCGALAANLVEAELFGHRRGAFTGAGDERPGLVRTADAGTLFLDEVGELPAPAQSSLLRVLQEGEVLPIGADRPIKVDVRVITATHRDLDADVAAARFRADLRARLLGVQIAMVPLRERPEDLGHLVAALLQRLAPDREIAFTADAVAALYAYHWPLNIRELERALAAAITIAGERIELGHLPTSVRAPAPETDDEADPDDAIRERLAAAIARHDGNLAAVARDLGKDRTQIRRWMKRFGLSREK